MVVHEARSPRVVELARKIEQDIATRGLQPGDPYMNTDAVARMLRVSKLAANQALQLLAQRRVLDRKQRRGTYVAQVNGQHEAVPVQSLLLVVHQNYLRTEGLLADGVVVGISSMLHNIEVQFAFTPPSDEAVFIERLIKQCMRATKPMGLVLVRSPLSVQRAVAQSGLPAVIFGMPHPSVTSLPWIDRDQFAMGRMLAQRVLQNGHRRLLVLMRDQMLPGDHPFQDGICAAAEEARLPVDALTYRDLPSDGEAVQAEVRLHLERGGDLPGIIARSETLAMGAMEACKSLGLMVGDEVAVVLADAYRRGSENPPPLPYIQTTLTPKQQGEAIARLLWNAAVEHSVESVTIPVELAGAS